MNETLTELLSRGGIAGALALAVWYVAKKLADTYESRIAALERASDVCEKDRIELRSLVIRHLTKNNEQT
jgi:hypothetical protein